MLQLRIVPLLLGSLLILAGCATVPASFPPASPESEGVSPEGLLMLSEHVDALVERESIVGAELHVISKGRTVFHRAYGWADRDERRAMETNSIFCVRSMTKPLVGTAIQMLIDEGSITLGTPVHEILPAFDRPETRAITVEHLLTHTSGFPFTTLKRPLSEYASVLDVAMEAAEHGPGFEPGTSFQYSDAGSDALGAIVAAVSGVPVEEFFASRILEPLQMRDALTLLESAGSQVKRIPSAYSGGTGNWERHWGRSDAPIFPVFLTSQSLYATTTDYARFLEFWMKRGQVDDRRLLSEAAVQRAWKPGRSLGESGFAGLSTTYGHQWVLHHPADAGTSPVVFGHDGSDGTHAWAWPERDLMVLFFTQSRGTSAGVRLQSVVDQLLIQNDVEGFRQARAASEEAGLVLTHYEGIYWDEDVRSAYYVVGSENGQLTVERPGRFRTVLVPTENPGEFEPDGDSSFKMEFEANPPYPSPAVIMTFGGGRQERQLRYHPDPSLPTGEAMTEMVSNAHGLDRLRELGIVRLTGTMKMPTRGIEATVTQTFDATRSRTEVRFGEVAAVVIVDGDRAFSQNPGQAMEELEGIRLEQALLDHPAATFGRWDERFRTVETLRRIDLDQGSVFLVRGVGEHSPGTSKIVNAANGLLVGQDGLSFEVGVGILGVDTNYGDYRDVSGLMLPFHVETQFQHPLIGKVILKFEEAEVGIDAPDAFSVPGQR